MRIVAALVLCWALPPAAWAIPLMPYGEKTTRTVAPRLFTGQLAEALQKAGCMPEVRGHWAFDARAHKPHNWRPVPPAAVAACVTAVLPLFPPAMTGAVLVWPFP